MVGRKFKPDKFLFWDDIAKKYKIGEDKAKQLLRELKKEFGTRVVGTMNGSLFVTEESLDSLKPPGLLHFKEFENRIDGLEGRVEFLTKELESLKLAMGRLERKTYWPFLVK